MRDWRETQISIAKSFEKASLGLVVISILLTVLTGMAMSPLPEFQTDLSAFAPETSSDEAVERVESVMQPSSHRIYVHVEPSEQGANILEIGAMQQLSNDLQQINQFSSNNQEFIDSHINAALILNLALDERDGEQRSIADFNTWNELLNAIIEDEECTDAIGNDRVIATASFARSVMLHNDFNVDPICDWLENDRSGDATPTASSTMWIIEIDGDLQPEDRLRTSLQIKDILDKISDSPDSALVYGVVSDDIVSNEINESTLDNLVWLLVISILVVVIVLALTFRSPIMVIAPLTALSAALIWTYGTMSIIGVEFSILEVAVAPVVLGLGIDYSIHLQRAYEKEKEKTDSPALAWISSFDILRLAISLSVITTVFAFLANILSPLPPIRTFGLTLALGVICAFVASTVTVGAMHVIFERTAGSQKGRSLKLELFADVSTDFQRRHTAIILLMVASLTAASVVVSVGQLDTRFELTDFLSDDMDSIEVRNSMYESYQVEALKSIEIIIEPGDGEDSLNDERDLLFELRRLDGALSYTNNVVIPDGTDNSRPSYDGIYPILRDAIEADESFGERHHLGVFDDSVDLTDGFQEGDLSSSIQELLINDTIGDPIRGEKWSERTAKYIALTEDNNSILYLRIQVDVTAQNSEDSSKLAEQFELHIQNFATNTGHKTHLTGDLILVNNVLSGLVLSLVESTAFSLGASLIVLFALTRRLGPSLVVILPVGLAGSWVVGAMAILQINWNVLTVMTTALTIGLGIDYSIHVWRGFEENRANGMGTWSAMRKMYATTGASLVMSAGTTICGFMVLVLSPVPVIRDFGLVSSISVSFSLILALMVLPGLLAAEVRTSVND